MLMQRSDMIPVAQDVYLFRDTCHVYVIRDDDEAILIDFGSGRVLDHLASLGIRRINHILMTHHHRDQGQGLHRAALENIPIWVPHMEQELFHSIDVHWQGRQVFNNYNVREDRFSLLKSVPVYDTLKDYETYTFGSVQLQVIPTPGHTPGSVSFVLDDGTMFTGDLIAGPGKLWSLAATQWSYNGAEGVAATILSLLDIKGRKPRMLLPSHGQPMENPDEAIDLLVQRLQQLLDVRGQYRRLSALRERPFEELTPHLLHNRACEAKSYVLLSESGKALVFDYGYDGFVGLAAGTDRAARRPWLYSLPALKEQFGVDQVEVVIPTHYHDDHVAGINLLKRVEGTQVWAAESFAPILESPSNYDIPCLWFDSIEVDRVLPLGRTFSWREYDLTLYPLPGHTKYAVAIYVEVDGEKVLLTGDQQGNDGHLWNYVYKNRFEMEDYRLSGELYLKLQPDLMLSGHWPPLRPTRELLETYAQKGKLLETLHRDILPLDDTNFGAEGFGVRLTPYQIDAQPGERVEINAEVRNPIPDHACLHVRLVVPVGWEGEQCSQQLELPPGGIGHASFVFRVPEDWQAEGLSSRRIRLAAELEVNGRSWGQQAESLVSVV